MTIFARLGPAGRSARSVIVVLRVKTFVNFHSSNSIYNLLERITVARLTVLAAGVCGLLLSSSESAIEVFIGNDLILSDGLAGSKVIRAVIVKVELHAGHP